MAKKIQGKKSKKIAVNAKVKGKKEFGLNSFTLQCMNLQGYDYLSNKEKDDISFGIRFTPAICTALAIIGLALQSYAVFWFMTAVGLISAIFASGNLFDIIYNYGIRFVINQPKIPPSPMPRRFACLIGAIVSAGAAYSFQYGFTVWGFALGSIVTLFALITTLTYWCGGAWLYHTLFGKNN